MFESPVCPPPFPHPQEIMDMKYAAVNRVKLFHAKRQKIVCLCNYLLCKLPPFEVNKPEMYMEFKMLNEILKSFLQTVLYILQLEISDIKENLKGL